MFENTFYVTLQYVHTHEECNPQGNKPYSNKKRHYAAPIKVILSDLLPSSLKTCCVSPFQLHNV